MARRPMRRNRRGSGSIDLYRAHVLAAKTFILTTWIGAAVVPVIADTTQYVDVNSTNAVPPYLTWATAASNINQVLFSTGGAGPPPYTILVTNGVYRTGGIASNRVYLGGSGLITVRSVNGKEVTT